MLYIGLNRSNSIFLCHGLVLRIELTALYTFNPLYNGICVYFGLLFRSLKTTYNVSTKQTFKPFEEYNDYCN